MTYLVYSGLYPSEDFYRADFTEVTGLELPENVEFKYKSATYPDHFGDYTSVSVINVGRDFYNNLLNSLNKREPKENVLKIHTTEFNIALNQLENLKMESEFSFEPKTGVNYYVGFLTDNKTIIVQRSSW